MRKSKSGSFRAVLAGALALGIALIPVAQVHADLVVLTYGTGGAAFLSTPQTVTGAWSFLDAANFSIKNTADPTKIVRFDISGIPTSTTRTYALPNGNYTLASLEGAAIFSGRDTFSGGMRIGVSNVDAAGMLEWNLAQTPDSNMLLTGTTSNAWIIAEAQDNTFDFAHAAQTDPTLFIHSHNQNATQWVSLADDGTNAVVDTGTGGYRFNFGGVWRTGIAGGVLSETGAGQIGFNSATNITSITNDAFFMRGGAAKIQMGADLNGAAIAQTFGTCNGITGTDIAGCNHLDVAGKGTGAGAPGDYDIQTAKDLPTGTTAQTLFDRHFYRGKAKALTESSATTFVSINAVTTLTYAGGQINYCIFATDATDVQSRCGVEDFAVVNKAGTLTCSTPNLLGTEATAISTGTLTNTFTFVANGTACDFKANAVSSLTQTTLEIQYSIEMHGLGTVTP